jgi:toxin YoeB
LKSIRFTPLAWSDYCAWQSEDRKTLQKINALLLSIARDGGHLGEGKPEHLKGLNAYSRRIDAKNRLVYALDPSSIIVLSCRGHYDD